MADVVMKLFEEYAVSFERGERPDLRAYLDRAGDGRNELASLVDVWLQVAPAPEPDEEAVALTEAWIAGEPPLVVLRTRRGLRRAEVVDRIIERFSLDRAKRQKVERYYHEVESGLRVPADEGLLAALGELLGARVRELVAWRPPTLEPDVAYFRAVDVAPMAHPAAPPSALVEDEVDVLFRARRV